MLSNSLTVPLHEQLLERLIPLPRPLSDCAAITARAAPCPRRASQAPRSRTWMVACERIFGAVLSGAVLSGAVLSGAVHDGGVAAVDP